MTLSGAWSQAAISFGELRPRGDLDLVGEPPDDLAEHADLVVAVAAGDQDVGRMPQRLRPALVGAARDRVVQILQKRLSPRSSR